MSLATAPAHVQLAVDLIALLESHEIDPITAEKALQIVLKDYQQKLAKQQTGISQEASTDTSG